MIKSITKTFIGMDVSEEKIEICILRGEETECERQSIVNSERDVNAFLDSFGNCFSLVVALETGTHSPWLSELIEKRGCRAYVADARKLRMIWGSDRKCDERDAQMLAEIVRYKPELLSPIKHIDKAKRMDLGIIKSRDILVGTKTTFMNHARGHLRSFGIKTATLKASNFVTEVYKITPPELMDMLEGIYLQIKQLDKAIKEYDKKVLKLCRKYPDTEKLRQVKGVGPLVSAGFVLKIAEPKKFKNSKRVASYIGLTPSRKQSGTSDKQLGISKHGDVLLRKLMIQSANYILGPFGEDCDLRRFGLRIMNRGGKIAKKKATTAVARKLTLLLHKLWISDEKYVPIMKERKKSAA